MSALGPPQLSMPMVFILPYFDHDAYNGICIDSLIRIKLNRIKIKIKIIKLN